MLPGSFGYRKPASHYHADRRGGRATERMREAFDGTMESPSPLAPEAITRQKKARQDYARQRPRRSGRVVEFAVAVVMVLLLVMIIVGALGKLP